MQHNQYQLCVNIRSRIMTQAAEVFIYANWGDDFALKQSREIAEKIINCEVFEKVNPNNLSSDQMHELGFGKWAEDSKLMLIPLWLFPFLCDEFEAGSISNDDVELVKSSEIDNDHRFGSLSYGVIPA